ncbi:hypothetical protein F5Y06DRAFT_294286 [Hypoxylon sp. FL0890]|nr:hypothetical protein F5Y06DRAFT_294286 [Hypoxylon sp. FL0890]
MLAHEQDLAGSIGMGEAAQPDAIQPEHLSSSPSSSSTSSSPISHTTTITTSSPRSSTDTLNNETNALPPRPSTPRTRRFQGEFLTLLTLLPAGRYPGPPSPSPSSLGRSPYSVTAVSDYSERDEHGLELEEDVQEVSYGEDRGDERGGWAGTHRALVSNDAEEEAYCGGRITSSASKGMGKCKR